MASATASTSTGIRASFASSLLLGLGLLFGLTDVGLAVDNLANVFNRQAADKSCETMLAQGQGCSLEDQKNMVAYYTADKELRSAPLDVAFDGMLILGGIALMKPKKLKPS